MKLEKQIMFLLSKKQCIEGKELIKIVETLNFNPQSTRNALAKMKKQGYLSSLDRGTYRLTSKGLTTYSKSIPKENFYYKDWDKQWLIVLIGIPESLRKKRDLFRNKLLRLGFGSLYKSVYVYPWNMTDTLLDIVDSLEIEEYVTITISPEFLLNKISQEGFSGSNTARRIWNIEEMNSLYRQKKEWLEESHNYMNELVAKTEQDALLLFSHYLRLKDMKEELLHSDPMLPPEFLPGDWLGIDVLDTLTHQLARLSALLENDDAYVAFIQE